MEVIIGILLILLFNHTNLPPELHQDNLQSSKPVLGTSNEREYILLQSSPHRDFAIWDNLQFDSTTRISSIIHIPSSVLGIALVDKQNNFISWLPEAEIKFDYDNLGVIGAGDHLYWWGFEDIDKDNNNEFYAQFAYAGTAGVYPFYLYTYKNKKFTLLLKLIEARSKAEVIDLDNDGIKEIVYKYALSGSGNRERETLRWKDIWRIEDGKPVKVNNQFPDEYKELIPIYDKALTTQYNKDFYEFDYPVYRCLKEKAELNINGQFVDAESCKGILRNKNKK